MGGGLVFLIAFVSWNSYQDRGLQCWNSLSQYLKADGPLYQSFSVPFLAIVGPEEVSRTIILISVLIPLEGKKKLPGS